MSTDKASRRIEQRPCDGTAVLPGRDTKKLLQHCNNWVCDAQLQSTTLQRLFTAAFLHQSPVQRHCIIVLQGLGRAWKHIRTSVQAISCKFSNVIAPCGREHIMETRRARARVSMQRIARSAAAAAMKAKRPLAAAAPAAKPAVTINATRRCTGAHNSARNAATTCRSRGQHSRFGAGPQGQE